MIHVTVSGALADGTPQHTRVHIERMFFDRFVSYVVDHGASVSTNFKPCDCPDECKSIDTDEIDLPSLEWAAVVSMYPVLNRCGETPNTHSICFTARYWDRLDKEYAG